MDWSNEPFVKLYTRDSGDMLAAGWEGRAVFAEILRKVDRAGVLDEADPQILAEMFRMPKEIVEAGVERLLSRNVLQKTPTSLVVPNFLEAQESRVSDRERQRKSRERRREDHLSVTKRDTSSRPVTRSHTESQLVTLRLDKTRLDKTRLESKPCATSGEVDGVVSEVLEYLSAKGPKKIRVTSKGHRKPLAARLREDTSLSAKELKLIIDHKCTEWGGGEMEQWIRPNTLFNSRNFDDYLDAAKAWEEGGRRKGANGEKKGAGRIAYEYALELEAQAQQEERES